MAIAVSSSLSLVSGHSVSHCHLHHEEGIHCSASHGIITNRFKKPHLDGFRNPIFWTGQTHWQSLLIGRELCPWKVCVAADYSDSVPDSSNQMPNGGYHPLEELKAAQKSWEAKLSSAEIAKTAVEANSDALLMFPGTVHCEPHEHITWDKFLYVVDDYGDMYFEIFDDANILEDPAASNPVIALIGMDMSTYENKRVAGEYGFDNGSVDETASDDRYYEIEEAEAPFGWGVPNTSTFVHPIYFSKCLTKVVSMGCDQKTDHPSNGVSILGCLRPAFYDEEPYVRKLFRYEDDSDWTDDEDERSDLRVGRNNGGHSALYRLEILRIELFSLYGIQSGISIQDFQDADPDYLAHSTSTIVEQFKEKGIRFDVALKALCKKKGLHVEGASLIGVDSLGMDVRVLVGTELQTHRFPFKVRATSEVAAEKQIQQLLFPRSRRKKPRNNNQSSFRDHPASF